MKTNIDDLRLWNTARSGSDIANNKDAELTGSESNLVAYYKLNNSYADSTTNGNTLTSNGSPSFSSTVPFAGGGGGSDAYTYAGTSYANPHAPTSISGTTLSYDNNGNLTAYGTTTYAYDYRNRLTQAALGNSTTTYAYDYFNDRTRQSIGTTTTWYPNKYFSQTATTSTNAYIATTTAYVYANDTLIATIDRVFINSVATGTPTFRYILPDYLGSTNVVLDSNGTVVQTLDYYPYGSVRVNDQVAAANSSRQFIGQFTDQNSLNYLNARYYDGQRGQFVSQDPVFWTGRQNIFDPQSLNSYSYANDNPITGKDPLGLFNQKTGGVEKGDTLSKITKILNQMYGTSNTVGQIASLNNISNPDRIFVGQTIKPVGSVPNITSQLNTLNQVHGAQSRGPEVQKSVGGISTPGAAGISDLDFINKVREDGSWDLKSQEGVFCQKRSCGGQYSEFYIYDGKVIPGDAPGNIHFGYVGKEQGYTQEALLRGAAVAQGLSDLLKGNVPSGDRPADTPFIIQGYGLEY